MSQFGDGEVIQTSLQEFMTRLVAPKDAPKLVTKKSTIDPCLGKQSSIQLKIDFLDLLESLCLENRLHFAP